jgi:NAD-reducing hydrogenase large subunit
LKDLDQIVAWAHGALKVARDYTLENLQKLAPFGSFPSNHLSLVRSDGAMDLYDGGLRAIDTDGNLIFDKVDYQRYLEYIAEGVRSWTYMKFPFITAIGPEDGWYRVGPLARVNACDFIDTPDAEAARQAFLAVTDGKPNNISMAYHWARMIELLHSVEKIRNLLNDPDLQGEDLVTTGDRRGEAVGLIEAPRGTLFHHYKVDENDQVTMANLIVSTTNNNEPMNRAVEGVAREYLSGRQITEGLLNHVEVVIRAYDPCLSCATHALGRMPLTVELRDESGNLLDLRSRNE